MRRERGAVVGLFLGLLISCSSPSGGGTEAMSYSQAVREIGRPPTSSTSTADGGLIARWRTEIPGGVRVLSMSFDRSRRLVDSKTETLPAGR